MLHEAPGWEFKKLNDSHLFCRWPAGTAVPSGLSTAISGCNWWMPLIHQMVTLLPTFPAQSRCHHSYFMCPNPFQVDDRTDTGFGHYFSFYSACDVSHGFLHLGNLDFRGPPPPSRWPSELKVWYSAKSHFPRFLLTVVCYLTGPLSSNPDQ